MMDCRVANRQRFALWRLTFRRTGCDSDSPLFGSSMFTRTDKKTKQLHVTMIQSDNVRASRAFCGLCCRSLVFAPIKLHADCMGFVLHSTFRSNLGPANARELPQTLCADDTIKLFCEPLFL